MKGSPPDDEGPFTLRFRNRMTGQEGSVRDRGRNRIREFESRADAEAYCRRYSTDTLSIWVDSVDRELAPKKLKPPA